MKKYSSSWWPRNIDQLTWVASIMNSFPLALTLKHPFPIFEFSETDFPWLQNIKNKIQFNSTPIGWCRAFRRILRQDREDSRSPSPESEEFIINYSSSSPIVMCKRFTPWSQFGVWLGFCMSNKLPGYVHTADSSTPLARQRIQNCNSKINKMNKRSFIVGRKGTDYFNW